jgi:hypothetical protein
MGKFVNRSITPLGCGHLTPTQSILAWGPAPSTSRGSWTERKLLAKAYGQLGDKQKSEEMAKRLVSVRNANWKSSGYADKNEDNHPADQ